MKQEAELTPNIVTISAVAPSVAGRSKLPTAFHDFNLELLHHLYTEEQDPLKKNELEKKAIRVFTRAYKNEYRHRGQINDGHKNLDQIIAHAVHRALDKPFDGQIVESIKQTIEQSLRPNRHQRRKTMYIVPPTVSLNQIDPENQLPTENEENPLSIMIKAEERASEGKVTNTLRNPPPKLLTPKEEKFRQLYLEQFDAAKPTNLAEIARIIGCDTSYVHQLRNRTFSKIIAYCNTPHQGVAEVIAKKKPTNIRILRSIPDAIKKGMGLTETEARLLDVIDSLPDNSITIDEIARKAELAPHTIHKNKVAIEEKLPESYVQEYLKRHAALVRSANDAAKSPRSK